MAAVQAAGEPRYRGEQVFRWLHERGAESAAEMSNVPPQLLERLAADHPLLPLTLAEARVAADETRKLRFLTHDGRQIESVLIPEEQPEMRDEADSRAWRNKLTLCVSSQVGCAIDCRFCATATLGFGRNLRAGEIVQQIYQASRLAGRRPSNLVFMGMGEPLHNFDEVTRAFALLVHPWGAAFSPRRITVSTAGLVPGIDKLAKLSPAPNLAISLNATTDDVRDHLMPINRKWPIAALLDAARRFPLAHRRKITFEYVLLDGVNDSDADALRLPKLLKGMAAMVNLIPWNPFPGPELRRSPAERVRRFQELLRERGMQTYIRTPRGDDIDAACGQLVASARAGGGQDTVRIRLPAGAAS